MDLDTIATALELMIQAELKMHCHKNSKAKSRLLLDALRVLNPDAVPIHQPRAAKDSVAEAMQRTARRRNGSQLHNTQDTWKQVGDDF